MAAAADKVGKDQITANYLAGFESAKKRLEKGTIMQEDKLARDDSQNSYNMILPTVDFDKAYKAQEQADIINSKKHESLEKRLATINFFQNVKGGSHKRRKRKRKKTKRKSHKRKRTRRKRNRKKRTRRRKK